MTRFVQWLAVVATIAVVGLTLSCRPIAAHAHALTELAIPLTQLDRFGLGIASFWYRFGWLVILGLYLPLIALAGLLTFMAWISKTNTSQSRLEEESAPPTLP